MSRNLSALPYLLFCVLALSKGADANRFKLKRVIVLSRHNVRAPLSDNLEKVTPYAWPKWSTSTGHLTPNGVILEELMGEYFAEWLKREKLFPNDCPKEFVNIYSNSRQRTKESAKAFARGAFKNCDIKVNYKHEDDRMDFTFDPIIHNNTVEFADIVVNIMKKKYEEFDLKYAYMILSEIVNMKESNMCKEDAICSFDDYESKFFYESGKEPNVLGGLHAANAIVDSFMMAYYDGMPPEDVAWGKINKSSQWKNLMDINKYNHNVRFNSTIIAKDAGYPLLDYLKNAFLNEVTKLIVLMGHDSNIYSVIAALNFQPYELVEQYEKTPIGGKLVFQKWYDVQDKIDLLKVDYVYQTTEQLRNKVKLSLACPPKWVAMEMDGCQVDSRGFCLWTDFVSLLKSYK